jgi:hypothetical protein
MALAVLAVLAVLHRLYITFTSTLFKIHLKQNWRETLAAASSSRQIGYL